MMYHYKINVRQEVEKKQKASNHEDFLPESSCKMSTDADDDARNVMLT